MSATRKLEGSLVNFRLARDPDTISKVIGRTTPTVVRLPRQRLFARLVRIDFPPILNMYVCCTPKRVPVLQSLHAVSKRGSYSVLLYQERSRFWSRLKFWRPTTLAVLKVMSHCHIDLKFVTVSIRQRQVPRCLPLISHSDLRRRHLTAGFVL
jgi:hypothetical protein